MNEQRRPIFNPPPGWPTPPPNWTPPKGWKPDPSWPAPPPGWLLWLPEGSQTHPQPASEDSVSQQKNNSPDHGRHSSDIDKQVAQLQIENVALRAQVDALVSQSGDAAILDDDKVLKDVGIYRYHHPLENAVAYESRLEGLLAKIAAAIKSGTAIEKSEQFTFNGSLAKGQRITNDLAKLMLRAYNAEAENVVRCLRLGNVLTAKKRLENSRLAIANLGEMTRMKIGDDYHALRIEEIELTADYLMKKQEEREAAREERERLREERRVEQELAAAREKLDKERSHILTVIDKLQTQGRSDPDLEKKLADVDSAIAQNDFRAANIRAGYVYVISNRGAFGPDVVKIGLTRRLEPLDRIFELGDASVPFRFDVHALYFSEDAVTLENDLHAEFSKYRLNWANDRKEFFFASPAQVKAALAARVGNLLEFAEHAESTEYLQSVKYWPNGAAKQ